jgi:hypothetical protein
VACIPETNGSVFLLYLAKSPLRLEACFLLSQIPFLTQGAVPEKDKKYIFLLWHTRVQQVPRNCSVQFGSVQSYKTKRIRKIEGIPSVEKSITLA